MYTNATDVRFEPGMQIHRLKPVKEFNYQASGDANAAAWCDAEMDKIATHPLTSDIHRDRG